MKYINGTYTIRGYSGDTSADINVYHSLFDNPNFVNMHLNEETKIKPFLENSQNVLLILSSRFRDNGDKLANAELSLAYRLKLPIIIVYTDYKKNTDILTADKSNIKPEILALWNYLPATGIQSNNTVLHIPNNQESINRALRMPEFKYNTMRPPGTRYFFTK